MFRTTVARVRDAGPGVWRTATWWLLVVFQVVFAAGIGIGWLIARVPMRSYPIFVAETTVSTALASFLISAALLRRSSSRALAMGLAVGGAGLIALIGGLTWGLIFLPLSGVS
ncbi:hypothetical protein [Mycolicibacter minnesotensis]